MSDEPFSPFETRSVVHMRMVEALVEAEIRHMRIERYFWIVLGAAAVYGMIFA